MAWLTYKPTRIPVVSYQPHKTRCSPSTIWSNSISIRANILLSSYSKSKPFDVTLNFFRLLPHRDTLSWNTILAASSQRGLYIMVLHLFVEMLALASQLPDSKTLRLVLEACAVTSNLLFALQVHGYIIKLQGLYSVDVITNTRLICLYREFGLIEDAHQVFERISSRDVVASVAMMTAFNEVGQYEETLRIFSNMLRGDYLVPNEFVFTCGLCACAGLCSLSGGEQIHAYAVKASVQSNVFVGTSLVDMYAKCDIMGSAKLAFSEISSPNSFSWNALMGGNLSGGQILDLFSQMRLSGVSPDNVTYATILRACKDVQLSLVQQLHGFVAKMMNIQSDVFIGTALFDCYVDHGCVYEARQVFEEIHNKDLAAFNSAIQGYIRNGHADKAINLFYEALQIGKEVNDLTLKSLLMRIKDIHHGKQLHALVVKFGWSGDEVITSLLVTIYSSFECFGDAVTLFDQVDNPDLILCTSLISSLCRKEKGWMALKLYMQMVSEGLVVVINNYTFSSLLHSCASLTALEEAKQIHAQVVKFNAEIGSDLFIASGLIDTYAKCGCITDARKLFDKMRYRDLASWNAIITGLAQHGYIKDVMETFHRMVNEPNIEPDHITFLGVLSACCHNGLVEEGYRCFEMVKEPTIAHYTCLVNLVGRAGRLDEALDLIHNMPFEPTEPIWTSMLVSSGMHGNIEIAEHSAEQLLSLNPKDPGTYIALSNIYAKNGRWKDVRRIRKLMKDHGVSKTPARSWLSINGTTHVFHAQRQVLMSKRCLQFDILELTPDTSASLSDPSPMQPVDHPRHLRSKIAALDGPTKL